MKTRESQRNPMPSRTIEESHRPRVSDRTMHCHSFEWKIGRLVVSENDGRRHNSEMEPQGRTIETPLRTRRQSKTFHLAKTTLRGRVHVQTVGLNAEKKNDRLRAEGEIFFLTFPLIGPYRFRDFPGVEALSCDQLLNFPVLTNSF